jgi:hypothetical protein
VMPVCCCVGQKLPVVVQNAEETAKLTGGFGRMAFLNVGHSFFRRLGALSRHLITEEDDRGYSEDTLHQVDQDPVLLKSVREGP